MKEYIKRNITDLFETCFGEKSTGFERLPISGSNRKYFRINNKNHSVVGTYNTDKRENIAFLTLSKHFYGKGLKVPKIFAEDLEKNVYLQEDLGDITLYDLLSSKRSSDEIPNDILNLYKKSIEELLKIQIPGSQGVDYNICYPRPIFDKQSMLWDLNYFKYYFVKLADVEFFEQDLENDFHAFTDYLLGADMNYFLYRDFQSRNIMVKDGEVYFIDYQGGRQGALQYDLASLLLDAKADIPQETRKTLLEYYIDKLGQYIEVDREEFIIYYHSYSLMRILQTFGAFGFRGFYEGKQHFLLSIPFALNNLKWILENYEIPVKIPELTSVLKKMVESEHLQDLSFKPKPGLTVMINSFAYKRALPVDNSGNGGGFIFDCRFLPNPGREVKYQALTGADTEVITFMENKPVVNDFLNKIYSIVDDAVDNYVERDFNNLMISFGCTGGQHRSVYCANKLAEYLGKRDNLNIVVKHLEQEIKQKE